MNTFAASFASASAAVALTLASPALADTVTFPGYLHGSESVTFIVPNQSTPGTTSSTVSAGGFSTVVNGATFETYCVDLYQTIAFNTPYADYVNVGGGHAFANSHAYGDLGRLYGLAGPILDAVHEAAFQMAVWEIAYETSGAYGLGTGVATFSATAGATMLASGWLSSLANAPAGPNIGVFESCTHQDVIYAPVPEPETYLMMVIGLAGMTAMTRRRKATAANRS